MEELRRVFTAAGFSDVETFIASGNVIFSSPGTDTAALERRIEAALEKAFGYAVATFVRTPAELAAIAAHMPCSADPAAAGGRDAHHLPGATPAGRGAGSVAALSLPGDELSAKGREIYWGRFGKLSGVAALRQVAGQDRPLPARCATAIPWCGCSPGCRPRRRRPRPRRRSKKELS